MTARRPVTPADAQRGARKPRRATARTSTSAAAPAASGAAADDGDARRVEWVDPARGPMDAPLRAAGLFAFEHALPVRGMPAFKGQWSKPGRYWMSGTGAHVVYESRFEMSHLALLDFDPDVVAVSAQPFRLRFGRASAPLTHVPDLFVRRSDGSGLVVDVKGALAAATDRNRLVFCLTAQACERMGLDYRIATEPDPAVLGNVRWLAGYRQPQQHTGTAGPALLAAAADGLALGAAVARAAAANGLHPAAVRPVLFHLMWQRQVTTDLTVLLDDDTPLARASAAAPVLAARLAAGAGSGG